MKRRSASSLWSLLALVLVGAGLRILTMNTRGLWLDEAVTVDQTTRTLVGTIMTQVGGTHPPLFHILMHFWIEAFGTSEIALRSLPLIFGVASIAAAYWAGKVLYDRRTGLLSAGIMAFAPYQIWYSQEARMYSMALFFGLLSLGFFALALRRNSLWLWAGYFAATTLGAFTHYFFAVLVVGEVLYFLCFELIGGLNQLGREGRRRASLRRPWRVFSDIPQLGPWLAASLTLAALLIAWLGWAVLLPQVTTGGSALISSISAGGLGYGQVGPSFAIRFNDVVLMLAETIVGFHPGPVMYVLVAMWPLSIYGFLLLLDYLGELSRSTVLLLCAASGVLVVAALGQWQGQVLTSRYIIALSAPATILVARVLVQVPKRGRRALLVLGVAFALVAWVDQSSNPQNMMRYDNREAIEHVVANYKSGDVIVYEPFYTDVLFDYYLPKNLTAYGFPQLGTYGQLRNAKVQIGQDIDRIAGSSNRVWLVLSFQNIERLRGDAYNTIQWLENHGFEVSQDIQMNQVEVILFNNTGRLGQPVPAGGGQ